MNFTILRFDQLESTNTEAINQAKRGADEGFCVIAEQTNCRTRTARANLDFRKRCGTLFQHRSAPETGNEIFAVDDIDDGSRRFGHARKSLRL